MGCGQACRDSSPAAPTWLSLRAWDGAVAEKGYGQQTVPDGDEGRGVLRCGRGRADRGQNLAVAMDPAGNVLRWGRGRAGCGQAEDPRADQVPDLPAMGPRPDWPRTVEYANELRIPVPILRWGRGGSGHGQISLRQQQHQVLLTSMEPQPSRPRAERAPRHDGKPDSPAMGPRPGRPRTSASLSTIGPATMWSRWSHGEVGRGQRRCSRLRHRCRTSCEGAAAVRPRTDHSRLAIHVLPTPLRWGRSRASRGQFHFEVDAHHQLQTLRWGRGRASRGQMPVQVAWSLCQTL